SNGAPIHGMSIIECSQGGFAIIGTVDTVPGAISHFVFWRIPANYNPMPSISPEQLLLITISGSLIIAFLVIIFWRKQNHPTQ
ncbi:MAG: hypothetical protein Q6361_02525, partial [Candidatus Hermodarchaeota archaeon]|nr:hypothetical protein [Candidatus Hermodarchaeota archaeon]